MNKGKLSHDIVIFPTGDELLSAVMKATRQARHQAVGAYLMRDRGNYRGKIGDALRGCFHMFHCLVLGALAEASFCEEEATLYTWEGSIR